MSFNDGENDYSYEGLSSGEKNVLLLLIRFVAERMHQSVVLIDELELNQHPLWQRGLSTWFLVWGREIRSSQPLILLTCEVRLRRRPSLS